MLRPTPIAILICKLRLKCCLREWNVQQFRNVHEEIEQATIDLNDIQIKIASMGDFDENFDTEMNCLSRLNDLLARRYTLLTQKN